MSEMGTCWIGLMCRLDGSEEKISKLKNAIKKI